jgi:hypothetical protein
MHFLALKLICHMFFQSENRKQSVILEGTVSMQVQVLSGVPQGTVLRPLLFLAYTNDMPETATSSEIKLFADDSLVLLLLYMLLTLQVLCSL